MYVSRV